MVHKFYKYLATSFGVHAFVIVALGVSSFAVDRQQLVSQNIDLTKSSTIKAQTSDDIVKSVAVSESELNKVLDKYKKIKNQRDDEYLNREAESKKIASELSKKQREITQKNKQLLKINKDIAKMKSHAMALKKQEQNMAALDKKKRNELEKKTNDAKRKQQEIEDIKKRAIIKKQKQEKEQEQLEQQRRDNEIALRKIAQQNKVLEERETALIRGKYEDEIHKLLYNAWILPFERKNVHCSVSLSLSLSGKINDFKFISTCPSSYKHMIDLAIQRINTLPKVPERIFKSTEIVNFIDSID